MKLDFNITKKFLKTELSLDVNNVAFTIPRSGAASIYGDRIIKAKDEPLYILIAKGVKKLDDDTYDYNLSEFSVYKLTEEIIDDILKEDIVPGNKYLLELSKLELIHNSKKANIKLNIPIIPQLTLYQELCVRLRVPESGNDDIDNLIRKSMSCKCGKNNDGFVKPF